MPVWVLGGHIAGFGIGEGLATKICFAVDLDVVEGAVGLREFVGVARVAVHMAVRVGSSTVREEMHDLMGRFLVGGQIVPEPVVS